jgi:hypothetical protein
MSHSQPTTQESEHIKPGVTLAVTVCVLIVGVVLGLGARLALSARSHTLAPAASAATTAPRPEPEVHHVRSDLFKLPVGAERLKERQRAALHSYGWVDREHGTVRLPIDIAMDLEVQAAQP